MTIDAAVAIFASIMASGGFWAFLQAKVASAKKQSAATEKVLLGVAHELIMTRAKDYIARGWITTDEYEDLYKYLIEPYRDLGGNGIIENLIRQINNLPIKVIANDSKR